MGSLQEKIDHRENLADSVVAAWRRGSNPPAEGDMRARTSHRSTWAEGAPTPRVHTHAALWRTSPPPAPDNSGLPSAEHSHKCKSHSLTIHGALIQQGAPSLAYSDTQCSPQYSDGDVDQTLPNLHFLLHRTVSNVPNPEKGDSSQLIQYPYTTALRRDTALATNQP